MTDTTVCQYCGKTISMGIATHDTENPESPYSVYFCGEPCHEEWKIECRDLDFIRLGIEWDRD